MSKSKKIIKKYAKQISKSTSLKVGYSQQYCYYALKDQNKAPIITKDLILTEGKKQLIKLLENELQILKTSEV